uniref:PHD finger protein ING n=1 Tax=Pyramimonas obovata TaxID=1411642 RepID=A0A7S0WGW1_9CHLO|mmetsp:Transcript_2516/g.5234  ORF Transcript_2516/g.5234 Transcript_2516/m.5234 type:complete len:247 (+) Transcript_2516:307-1047(+)|eukprot:CAMPEP_0118924038 /NCGR_PEP_ID=MMETSP1169-20130426/2351_1 /TAXON_ID=36882 /ORGANISM="Pyramimonas obovata, Strain CCMP722" /LENGTH=246 /DNA_ID=CAMNT_0006865117 /DNA_START=311 /DNA_END=1051 /DNA_ORIENTATION=-
MPPSTPLEEYLESVSGLPAKIQHNFTNLRELDEKSKKLHEELDQQVQQVWAPGPGQKRSRRTTVTDANAESKLEPFIKQCQQVTEGKVALAMQTYDLVDVHIQRLDKSLRKLEEVVKQRAEKEGVGAKDGQGSSGGSAFDAKRKGGDTDKRKKRDRLTTGGVSLQAPSYTDTGGGEKIDIDLPIDPNEPTYCVCNRVSFGEMIACDNNSCRIEWFHFECVGLSRDHKQKGKWYCPECAALKKKAKK